MNFLFWIYFVNAVLLINHEIDSAFWKEWELFGLGKNVNGLAGFLIMHFFMIALILYGLLEVYKLSFAGLIMSLVLSLGGIFAFCIHIYFIKRGRKEFAVPVSLFILSGIFVVSLIQLVLSLHYLII